MNPYLLIPIALLLAGLLPVFAYRKMTHIHWHIIVFGAGAWFVSVALKSTFAYFFNTPVNIYLASVYIPLYYVYVGLLTGVFEIFIPLFLIAKYKSKFESVISQIGFGIGFGCVEAIIIGITSLISFFAAQYLPAQIPPQILESLNQSISGTTSEFIARSLAGGIERLSAAMVHVFCAFMLFRFVFQKKMIYLLVPILLKTITDGFALYFAANTVPTLYFEAFYLAIGLLCLFMMLKIMKDSNLKLSTEAASTENHTRSKSYYLSRLKAAGFIFAFVGWFLLIAVIFENSLETQLLEAEKFIKSPSFQWGLRIFILGFIIVLFKWQYKIDEAINKHKWLKVTKNLIILVGVIGWIIGLGSLVIK